ncbi:MAG: hypothetical protein JRH15_23180 [Deltaproteobacteria bacterium]|nr:hypothetical protein [Deltaproteobacteria bacterium]
MAETMTREERLKAAFTYCEKPDRVPVTPAVSGYTAASFYGKTFAESHIPEVGLDLILKSFDDLGGWDGIYLDLPLVEAFQILVYRQPMRWKIPGRDLPDNYINQPFEEEVLKAEDYDKILEMGFENFWNEDYVFRVTDWQPGSLDEQWEMIANLAEHGAAEWAKRDVASLFGWGECHPFFILSLARSFVPFTKDLYFNADKVEAVISKMTDEAIPRIIATLKEAGSNNMLIGEERASAFHYPPEMFDRFWMPYTAKMVDAFWSEGIFTTFHLDTDFSKNVHAFKQLPEKSFCLHFDSTTDMFKAKEIMGNHCSFMGDVPAAMLSLGTPQDVEAYSTKLIKEVGKDGGFILNAGCECPCDAKKENIQAMIDVAKTSLY